MKNLSTIFVLLFLAIQVSAFEGDLIATGDMGYENALVELEPKSFEGGELIFTMNVNTHSVSFEFFDLQKSAVLYVNNKEYFPVRIPELYDHHNEGELVYSITDAISTDVKIIILNMAGEDERKFLWPNK